MDVCKPCSSTCYAVSIIQYMQMSKQTCVNVLQLRALNVFIVVYTDTVPTYSVA